jgi:transcription elongation factor B subunit 1
MSEESEYVTLISSDGYSFIVQRSSACISGAIKRMLDPSCTPKQYHTYNVKAYTANTTLQMASPNPRATRAVSRTSSEHIPHIIHRRVATELICVVCSGLVLEKVCEYFYYNEKHKNSKDVPDIDVPAELCLELLMAADYLNGTFVLRIGEVYILSHLLTLFMNSLSM